MSITLGKLLKELNPEFSIALIESRPNVAQESSNGWNNAGTGHAGLCELNLTPEVGNTVNIDKALHVTEAFYKSLQFWSYLVNKEGYSPDQFIHNVAHMSFVDHDIEFLRKRFDTMKSHHFYETMEYSEDKERLKTWMPLVMKG